MVDHGYLFNGPHWEYVDTPASGLYFRPSVYRHIRSWADFQPWLDRILNFPEEIVDDTLRGLPTEWLNGDADSLYTLLERLMNRRRKVPDLLRNCGQEPRISFRSGERTDLAPFFVTMRALCTATSCTMMRFWTPPSRASAPGKPGS